MDSFLALVGSGRLKEQQQIALKLHKSSPEDPRFLYWALLTMVLQSPNRCNSHTERPRDPILVSIAYRCLQTLLSQHLKLDPSSSASSNRSFLEDPSKFWVVLKVLEMVGQSFPEEEDFKIVGISKLKYPPSLFQSCSTSEHQKTLASGEITNGDLLSKLNLSSPEVSPSSQPPITSTEFIESRSPELPEYISLPREEYFKIFDSSLGREMRNKYLNLELMWRERAVDWANPVGLKELVGRMKERLLLDDHNWNTFITLNQCIAQLISTDASNLSEFHLLDNLYLQMNAQEQAREGCERGFSLARIDLRCRLQTVSPHSLPDDLNQTIYSYFDQFGDKICCFDDLTAFLKLLKPDEASKLRTALKASRQTQLDQNSTLDEIALRRQINLEKLLQSIAMHPDEQNQAADAARLIKNYFKYLPLGRDLPATTLQPADGMAILAAQILLQDWQGTGHVANLYAATWILEECLANSVQQYQARSLLIRLHRLLGNSPRNLLYFAEFGMKHIQHDTLSHLGLDRCSIFFGHRALVESEDTQRQKINVLDLIEYPAVMYEYIESDTLTWIEKCYANGNYIKVEDFHFFQHQINFSLQRKILRMERIRLQLFERTRLLVNKPNKNDNFSCTRLDMSPQYSGWDIDEVFASLAEVLRDCQYTIDNRDFTVIPDCQPWSPSGTCNQTSLGPVLGSRWLWALSTAYARILMPQFRGLDNPSFSEPDFFSECTPHEVELYHYSRTLATLLLPSTSRNLQESLAQTLLDFFQRRNSDLDHLIKRPKLVTPDKQVPPSRVLAIIHNAYEGFCLFEFAYEQQTLALSLPFKHNLLSKTLKVTRSRIILQLKRLDGLIQKLLDLIELNPSKINEPVQTMCLFGSHVISPWEGENEQDFGTGAAWKDSISKIHTEQRETLIGWQSLIKLVINFH